MKRGLACFAIIQLLSTVAYADNVTAGDAAGHIGEAVTVCGTVASVTFSAILPGQPTFLNFGQPYPNQEFTVTIWGAERPQVGRTDNLVGRRVCVTGSISAFHGRPQLFLQNGSLLKKEPASP